MRNMKTHFCSIILAAALSASTLSCFAQQQPEPKTGLSAMVPDKGELDKRMRWFDNARFGMFIHWEFILLWDVHGTGNAIMDTVNTYSVWRGFLSKYIRKKWQADSIPKNLMRKNGYV